KLETSDHSFEQRFQPHDRVEVVGGRIETENDVAAAVREAVENREEDLPLVVAGAVWLDACAEMPRMANGDPGSRERIEQRARDRRQFVVRHPLGNRRNGLAGQ